MAKVDGLGPVYKYAEPRMLEIQRAMNRYMAEGMEVPVKWIQEYNELSRRLSQS